MPFRSVKLKDCCTVVGGATPKRNVSQYWGGTVPWVTPKDISQLDGPVLWDAPECITEEGYKSCATTLLPKGTVLLTSRAPIGNVAIAGKEMCTNQGFKSLIPGDDVDSTFLYYCIKHHAEKLKALGNGATFKEVSKRVVESFEIPLPTLARQKQIANVLDKSDAVRRKCQQAIELAEQFLRSVFLEMFDGAKTAKWKHSTVGGVARQEKGSMRTGPFGSQLLHSEFTAEGIPVLGIDNVVTNTFRWAKPRFISEEKYSQLRRYTVQPNDVLISIMGTCGRCAVVPEEFPVAINTKHLCCITLDQSLCLPDFLHAYFLYHPSARDYLSRNSKGAIMDGLNMSIIRELPVPLAPLDLQLKYSKLKATVERMVEKQSTALLEAEDLFSSLAQRAFS